MSSEERKPMTGYMLKDGGDGDSNVCVEGVEEMEPEDKMETEKKYRYFVRYVNQVGGGSTSVDQDTPIACMGDIRAFEEKLDAENPKNGMHIITFWKRFEEHEE